MALPRLCAALWIFATALPVAAFAQQQQDRVRVTVNGTTGMSDRIIVTRPAQPSGIVPAEPVVNGLGMIALPLLLDSMDSGESPAMEQGSRVDSPAQGGVSNTFFIRRVPEGTVDFIPTLDSSSAPIDNWTEQLLTGADVTTGAQRDAASSVTTWTGALQDTAPAQP